MNDGRRYPTRVEGDLAPELSRGLWLVKWLLALPHFIVLSLLWTASFVCTIVALFAILFTGVYPRGLFDFNLGVVRWTWRVMFYSYGALGTDRYPPFSLGEERLYPARITVSYPETSTRSLVVTRWVLGIPHFLLVSIFHGGMGLKFGGLNGILVVFSAIALLFTRRYPRSLFKLIRGLNRWSLRVLCYAMLLTDVYPPFRLEE